MPQFNNLDEVFAAMEAEFNAEQAAGVDAVFQFIMTGDEGGLYWLKVVDQQVELHEGEHENPTLTLTAKASDYLAVVNGDLPAMTAFMQGKIKVKGDMGMALKLQAIFGIG